MSAISRWLWDRRRRFAPMVLVVGLIVVVGEIYSGMPRETEVRYRLGPDHRDVTAARIDYLVDGEEVAGAQFNWREGAPETIHHTVDLSPGRYEVTAELSGPSSEARGGESAQVVRDVRRALVVPADGVVTIELFDLAYASRESRR